VEKILVPALSAKVVLHIDIDRLNQASLLDMELSIQELPFKELIDLVISLERYKSIG